MKQEVEKPISTFRNNEKSPTWGKIVLPHLPAYLYVLNASA